MNSKYHYDFWSSIWAIVKGDRVKKSLRTIFMEQGLITKKNNKIKSEKLQNVMKDYLGSL